MPPVPSRSTLTMLSEPLVVLSIQLPEFLAWTASPRGMAGLHRLATCPV